MKKLICFSMAITIFLSSLLLGCNSTNKALKISYDLGSEPKNLDPQSAVDSASLNVINNTFEGLLILDENGNLQNGNAVEYNISSDGLKYSFKLKDNLKWSNGTKLTAHDYVFGFRRLLSDDTKSPHAQLYFSIKNAGNVNSGITDETQLGVIANSDTELTIELDYKNSNFLKLLAKSPAVPCNEEFFKNTKGKYGLEATKLIYNGPFEIASWKHKISLRLSKNNEYYDANEVNVQDINLWIDLNPDDDKALTITQRLIDEKTLSAEVDGFDIEKLSNKGFNSESIESASWGIIFNTENNKFKNKNLRLAFASAFDRSTYKNILPKSLKVSSALIPHSVMLENNIFREKAGEDIAVKFNSKTAYEYYKTALTELDVTRISGLRLLMPKKEGLSLTEYFLAPSQIIQKELGLFIGVDEVDEADYQKRLLTGDFDCALVSFSATDNTPFSILSQFSSDSSQNFFGYSNNELDNILTSAAINTDANLAYNNYIKAEKMIIDDAVFIPMYYKTDYLVVNQIISGVSYNPYNGLISFKNTHRSK